MVAGVKGWQPFLCAMKELILRQVLIPPSFLGLRVKRRAQDGCALAGEFKELDSLCSKLKYESGTMGSLYRETSFKGNESRVSEGIAVSMEQNLWRAGFPE